MWNDGYSKEQPWLNYFNSYERMHCCFGDADGADGDGDGGVGTGGPGIEDDIVDVAPENFSIGPGTGMGPGGSISDPDAADPEPDARDATYNAQTNSFDFAVDKGADNFAADIASIGIENFENPSDLDLGTMNEMYNNPDAYGMGYNDFVDMGFFDKSAAAEYEQEKAEAAALQDSYTAKGKDVGISVDRDGNYSYTGKDAGTVGLSEMGKGFGLLGETFGIGSVMGGLDRAFGKGSKDVAQDGGTTAFNTVSGFVGQLASYPFEVATDIIANVADFLGKAVSEVTTTEVDAALSNNQSTSQGAYAQGVNTRDTPFGPMTFDSRDAAMGFNNDYDIGGEDTVPVLPVLPTPEPEEEKEPRTAMEAYFDRMGIPSKPKTIPGRSFDFGVPPRPVNSGGDSSSNNNDIFSQEAARRRQMAMASPKYQEPSGINSSIAIFAAANGMSYEEAALRFAPPNVPKEMDDVRPTLPVLTTFAASGGGLNSLMRYK